MLVTGRERVNDRGGPGTSVNVNDGRHIRI